MSHTSFCPRLDSLLRHEERNLQKVSLRRHCSSFLLQYFLGDAQGVDDAADGGIDEGEEDQEGPLVNKDVLEASLEPLGYPGYTVNVHGQVWNDAKQTFLSAKPRASDGTCRVQVYNSEGKRVCRYVHDLIARAFLGAPPVKVDARGKVAQVMVVAHLNGDSSDNRLVNLAWMNKNDGRPLPPPQKHARVHLKNGLFRAVTWSVRCTASDALPKWIPVITWFNLDEINLMEELGVDEACQERLRSFFRREDGHDDNTTTTTFMEGKFDRFELAVDEDVARYFPRQHWKEVAIEDCRPVQVSLGGLVREINVKGRSDRAKGFTSIGSGQVLGHGRRHGLKVFYAHPTCAVGGKGWPEIRVDELVLTAWLGGNYWEPFIVDNNGSSEWQSSQTCVIVHLDGNLLNSHLFNLAVFFRDESHHHTSFVFDEDWARRVYAVYSNNKEIVAASKQQQQRRAYECTGPRHVLELFERKVGVFSPSTLNTMFMNLDRNY